MAIIDNQNEEENKDNNPNAAPQLGVQSGTLGPNTGNPGASKGTSSGRFNNIGNYIKANQGFNAQSGGLAGKVAGNIQGQAQQVQGQIGQAANKFGEQSQAGRTQYNQGLVQGALSDPTQFAANKQNLDQFAQQRDAAYKGPQGLENQAALQAGAQNVQQLAGATGTEGGRFGLLRQMFNKPTYTGGQQKLDSLLLQGNQGQLKQLQNTRGLAGQTAGALQQQNQAAQAQAQAFGNEAKTTQELTRQALTGKQTSEDEALNERVKAAQGLYDTTQSRLTSGLQQGELSQEDINRLGLSEGTNLYNINPLDYLQTDARKAGRTNVASAADYARQNALAKLAGKEASTEFYDPSQAGAFEKDQFGFDKDRFMSDIAGTKATYERQLGDVISARDAANKDFEKFSTGRFGANNPEAPSINWEDRASWLNAKVNAGYNTDDFSEEDRGLLDAYKRRGQTMTQEEALKSAYGPTKTLKSTGYSQSNVQRAPNPEQQQYNLLPG